MKQVAQSSQLGEVIIRLLEELYTEERLNLTELG